MFPRTTRNNTLSTWTASVSMAHFIFDIQLHNYQVSLINRHFGGIPSKVEGGVLPLLTHLTCITYAWSFASVQEPIHKIFSFLKRITELEQDISMSLLQLVFICTSQPETRECELSGTTREMQEKGDLRQEQSGIQELICGPKRGQRMGAFVLSSSHPCHGLSSKVTSQGKTACLGAAQQPRRQTNTDIDREKGGPGC